MEGELDAVDAAMAKMWLSNLHCKVVDECLQLFGGWGYMWEYPIARAYADARIVKIAGGSIEIMKHIIGRKLFAEYHKGKRRVNAHRRHQPGLGTHSREREETSDGQHDPRAVARRRAAGQAHPDHRRRHRPRQGARAQLRRARRRGARSAAAAKACCSRPWPSCRRPRRTAAASPTGSATCAMPSRSTRWSSGSGRRAR